MYKDMMDTIGMVNAAGGRIYDVAEIGILLDTGAEVVAGSTRMKAGTAQKVALNCFSTGVMIQLGFVYLPFMNTWFGTTPLPLEAWGPPMAIGVLVFLIIEGEKALLRIRAR